MRLLGKLLAADPGDVGRAVEAAAAIVLARLSLRLARLESLTDFSGRLAEASAAGPAPSSLDTETWERAASASNAAGAVLGTTCLPKALALQWTLARRGFASDLCLGFPREGAPLPGHAWIEAGDRSFGRGEPADGRGPSPRTFEILCRLPRRRRDGEAAGGGPPSGREGAAAAFGRAPFP